MKPHSLNNNPPKLYALAGYCPKLLAGNNYLYCLVQRACPFWLISELTAELFILWNILVTMLCPESSIMNSSVLWNDNCEDQFEHCAEVPSPGMRSIVRRSHSDMQIRLWRQGGCQSLTKHPMCEHLYISFSKINIQTGNLFLNFGRLNSYSLNEWFLVNGLPNFMILIICFNSYST